MKQPFGVSALALAFCFSCLALGQEEWGQDLDFLWTELPKRHPNLFHTTPRETFENGLSALRESGANQGESKRALNLHILLATLKDEHTGIDFGSVLQQSGQFPLGCYWFADGLHVLQIDREHEGLLGAKLATINDIPIDTVMERLAKLLANPNEGMRRHRLPNMLPSVALLEHFDIVDGATARFTFVDAEGEEQRASLHALSNAELRARQPLARLIPEQTGLCWVNQRQLFWWRYLEEAETLYVQYNRCTGREVEERYGSRTRAQQMPSFEAFAGEVLEQLERSEVKRLVFDLRHNPGGSSPQGTALVKRIASIQRVNQPNRIYVVIGRRTFSSAILNALDFQRHTTAILVGEPTSGKPNHFGEVRSFQLPHSGLSVHHSTKYFRHAPGDADSLIPDKVVETRFSDYRAGIDPVWEWIVEQPLPEG